jgi:hypothetical protein
MTKGLVKKLLHKQMAALRTAAKSGDAERVKLLMDLWKDS